MRNFFIATALLALFASAAGGKGSATGPDSGDTLALPASLDFMETLPLLRDLVICREASTHDKKGGNDNGFTNKAEHVRREFGNRVVIFEAAGPGSVQSFWYSWLNHPQYANSIEPLWSYGLGKVRFFVDGERAYSVPLRNLIGKPPFDYPLSIHGDDSTGGYITYLPMPYQEGMKIVIDGGGMPDFFYHVWYHTYPGGTDLSSWTLPSPPPLGPEWDLATVMTPLVPSEDSEGRKVHGLGKLTIPPGGEKDLLVEKGPGVITSIRMKLPEDDTALRSLVLKAWWDDDASPSIEAPLSLFYAVENRFAGEEGGLLKSVEFQGLVVGRDREGFFYLNLPMPFARRARLAIANDSGRAQTIKGARIEKRTGAVGVPGRSSGYLRTQFRQSRDLTPGRDYLLARIEGRGHIVGCVLATEDIAENFLEGDERIYTDGNRSPLIMGDATETYFNGSWYFFGGPFSCPLHGAPTFNRADERLGSDVAVTMYRFHLTDFVPFRGSADFFIQHGGFNNVYGSYRSLVFYYGVDLPSLVRTDYVSLSDPADLAAHGFSDTVAKEEEKEGFFEGVYNGQHLGLLKRPENVGEFEWMIRHTVTGVFQGPPPDSPDLRSFTVSRHQGPYEFTVKVDPGNRAVMLRRLFDQSVADQRALVLVDGEPAGIWYNPGSNRWKIFSEDDLILDPSLTTGKDELRIEVVPESKVFTAVEYSVLSIVVP